MYKDVEQLLRERCPRISEQFLPDLLATLNRHDIDASMLLGGDLTDEDLQAIGVEQLGVRRKLLKAFGTSTLGAEAPAGASWQHEDARWDWAQPPHLRNNQQSAASQRQTLHPSAAQAQGATAAAAAAAAPSGAGAAPAAASPATQPKVRRRAIMPPPSSPPDVHPVFARVHEPRFRANAEAHAWQRAAEQQQQQQQGQGQRRTAEPDQRLQPAVPAQARPQPVPASTNAERAASVGSENGDGATQAKKLRRTASSLSAKEAKQLQSQREKEISATVQASGWAEQKWGQLTKVGSDSAKALNKAVKSMARKYTGIDGKNCDEREKLYFDKFRLAHKRARHITSVAAASAGQPAAGRAPQQPPAGTPPQEAMLTPGNLLHVRSQPVTVKGEARPQSAAGR